MPDVSSNKSAKLRKNLDIVLTAAFLLDELPDNPNLWSEAQAIAARDAILTLGAPESFLRRFARSELPS
jgi:hypothetical protein